jgi:hypothetical protein
VFWRTSCFHLQSGTTIHILKIEAVGCSIMLKLHDHNIHFHCYVKPLIPLCNSTYQTLIDEILEQINQSQRNHVYKKWRNWLQFLCYGEWLKWFNCWSFWFSYSHWWWALLCLSLANITAINYWLPCMWSRTRSLKQQPEPGINIGCLKRQMLKSTTAPFHYATGKYS